VFPLPDFWLNPAGLPGRPGRLFGVSPDRACFFVQSDPQSLQLRDAAGKPLGPPVREGGILLAAGFGPDGKTFWTESGPGYAAMRLFRLRRVAGGGTVLSRVVPPGWPRAFSPDGTTLLTGPATRDKPEIGFWNTVSGEAEGEPLPVPGQVNLALFSPDSRRFAAATGDTVRVWDLASRQTIGPLSHPWPVTSLGAYAGPGGDVLLAWSGNKARLWAAATGEPIGAPLEHSTPITSFLFSPDGAAVVLGNLRPRQDLRVGLNPASVFAALDRRTGKVLGNLKHPTGVSAWSFRADGQYLATLDSEGVIRLWRAGRWECLASSPPRKVPLDPVAHLSWGPDGRTLIAADSKGGRFVWHPPFPLEGAPAQLRRRLEALTGQALDDEGVPHPLDATAWEERRKEGDSPRRGTPQGGGRNP
jgi:WD40 repeat protein